MKPPQEVRINTHYGHKKQISSAEKSHPLSTTGKRQLIFSFLRKRQYLFFLFLSLFAVASVVASCNSGGGGSSSPGDSSSGGSGDTHTVGDYTVKLVDKTLTITGYDGSSDVVLPASLKVNDVDYPITVIGENAFQDKSIDSVDFSQATSLETIGKSAFEGKDLTADITIPASVVTIGESAFAGNHLTDVSFDSSSDNTSKLTTIGASAFADNDLTADITIPASVVTIGESAFAGNHLTDVSFDSNSDTTSDLETIGKSAFADNDLTADITIPASVVTIGESAFQDNSIDSVTFADGSQLTSVGANAFAGNLAGLSVRLPEATGKEWQPNEIIGQNGGDFSVDYNLVDLVEPPPSPPTAARYFTFQNGTITDYSPIGPRDVSIPATIDGVAVTAIGEGAFEDKGLTSVTIPASVTTIGANAFRKNLLLARVTFAANSQLISVGANAFADNAASLTVALPTRVGKVWSPNKVIGQGVWGFNESYSRLDFIFSDGTITVYTDYSNDVLKEVVIPATINGDAVTAIGNNAFENKGLTRVTIPASVTAIAENAFQGNQLTSVTFADESQLTSVGANAFADNRNLSSVMLPTPAANMVWNPSATIGQNGGDFSAAYRQTPFVFSEGTITDYRGSGGEVTIPETINGVSVTAIVENAFKNKALTSVTIPASVTTIGASAFQGNQLTSVTFEANSQLTSVGANAFAGNADSLTVALPTPTGKVWSPNMVIGQGDWGFDESYSRLDFVFSGGTITGYNNDVLKEVVIPATINGDAVTAIGANAFEDKGLTSVTIPASVTTIGENAFQDNQLTITSVTFEANSQLTSVGANAFAGNLADLSVTLPTATGRQWSPDKIIGENGGDFSVDYKQVFTDASDFVFDTRTATITGYLGNGGDVTIPKTIGSVSVTAIGNNAFENKGLTSVTIPASVTTIGESAFRDNQLTKVNFSGDSQLIFVGANAFAGNPDGLTVPLLTATEGRQWQPNATIGGQNGGDFSVDYKQVFTNAQNFVFNASTGTIIKYIGNGGDVTIPGTIGNFFVTAIGNHAFRYKGLTSVNIPASVTTIGESAFRDNQLTTVGFTGESQLISVGANAFADNSDDLTVPLPTATGRWQPNETIGENGGDFSVDYKRVFTDQNFVFNASTGTIIEYIGNGGDVTIPVTIGNVSVTAIGNNAFRYKKLTRVSIPVSVTTIGSFAFPNNDLTSVTIPASVTMIGSFAFQGNNIDSVTFADGSQLTSVGANAFADNSDDLTVPLPMATDKEWQPKATIDGQGDGDFSADYSQVTAAQYFAFSGGTITGYSDDGPKDVVIPDKINEVAVTAIGEEAFNKNGLTSVIIPDSVTTIGDSAFAINSLTSVRIPDSVTAIGDYAFHQNQLTSVIIPDSVTEIRAGVFQDNSIDSVIIPASVTTIGSSAYQKNQLTSVTFAAGSQLTSIGGSVFRYNQLEEVRIPASVTSIGGYAFQSNQLKSVSIPASVTSIGNNAFQNNQLTRVDFVTEGSQLTMVGFDAFSNNDGLVSVTLPPRQRPGWSWKPNHIIGENGGSFGKEYTYTDPTQ